MRLEYRLVLCAALAAALAAPPPGVLAQEGPEEPLMAGADGVPVPKRTRFVQPVYPPEAAAQGLRGIVILELVIGPEGQVESVAVIRSVPPFDEAARFAAEQWAYEPSVVDGRPVRVRLTVPISFLMKLPEVTRQDGIPELRSGALPPFPPETATPEVVTAFVTLAANGQVAEAAILEGRSPWTESLIRALLTWRFDPRDLEAETTISFRVEAHYKPEGRGVDENRVELALAGLQTSMAPALADAGDLAPAAGAKAPPSPVGPGTTDADPPPPAEAAPDVAEAEAPAAETGVSSAVLEVGETQEAEVASAEAPTAEPRAPEAPSAEPEPAEEPAADTATPDTRTADAGADDVPPRAEPEAPADPEPGTVAAAADEAQPDAQPEAAATADGAAAIESAPPETADAADTAPGSEAAAGAADTAAIADPGTEVLTADGALPPEPEPVLEPGISSVRGVFLEAGVPDLSRGRRPVVPPFARISREEGEVQVRFAVDASGEAFVNSVEGPDTFRLAARTTVESWFFPRETAERLYLLASFSYREDLASATVRLEHQRQLDEP